MQIVWFLLLGALAGWIAGKIMKGGGFGAVGNIVVGVVGVILGGYLFGILGIGVQRPAGFSSLRVDRKHSPAQGRPTQRQSSRARAIWDGRGRRLGLRAAGGRTRFWFYGSPQSRQLAR